MADWRSAWRHLDRLPEVAAAVLRCRHPIAATMDYLRLRPFGRLREFELLTGGVVELASYEDLVTAWIVFLRREYRLPPGAATIVDLGANIGCFSLLAALERPQARIASFEPFPSTYERLRSTITRNHLERRVVSAPVGVGARSERRVIPDSSAPSQSLGMLPAGSSSSGTTIAVLSLGEVMDWVCGALKVDAIDFVKMDVEGAEHEAVAAASPDALRRVAALAMEYHPNGDKRALFDKLASGGLVLTSDRPIGPAAGIAHFARR